MFSRSIVVLGAFAATLVFASAASAQDVAPPPNPGPAPTDAGAPAPSAASASAPTITVTQDELDKMIDEHIAKKRADEAAAAQAPKNAPPPAEATPDKPADPFAFADFSWAPGNYGSSDRPLSFGPFTGELRMDTVYHYEFSHPSDNTISGSSEVFRSNEVQVTQIGFGGDFLYKNVQARLMTQFGMYSQTTPRNDSSPSIGQWNLADAYRYISEAYGGYHIPVMNGINIQAGIFMSYVGLWSYYNFDNWTYQPSYVSSNTPWFFNGMRIQIFPSDKVKIEPWIVNGWQSYGKFNQAPGVGMQLLWKPTGYLTLLGNQYFGTDALGVPDRKRIHTDDSIMVKYYENKGGAFSKAAASLTADAGCEMGGDGAAAVTCDSQFFLGFMAYQRVWLFADEIGLTVGGGAITNPGRYLVLLPPVNGATAASGTPYFTENPGDKYEAWDMQLTADYMPSQFITFRTEYNHRAASTPYFAGSNGMTPPGGNQGSPGSMVEGWNPDLVNTEDRLTVAMMLKF